MSYRLKNARVYALLLGCGISAGSSTGCGALNIASVPIVSTPAPTVVPGHPFISLKDYEAVSRTSAAYTRLKNEVDAVVTVTASMGPSTTHAQLVTALNSGHYGYSVVDAVIMYRLTADAKYIQQAIRMMDLFVKSENQKIAANTNPTIAGDSYLDVGPHLEQLALTYDYGYALLTDVQRTAWAAYAEQALFNVWNHTSAKWGTRSAPWTGWSVSDPGNNYHFSFLKATMLWALAAQSASWRSVLENQKFAPVTAYYSALAGGGSREGTGYGTAHKNLFEIFRYWKASTGVDLSALTTHTRDTIDYWVHATVPTMTYYAPIGDQARSANPLLFDYQRQLVQEAVALNAGTAQAKRGAWWLNRALLTDGGSGTVTGRMRYNFNFRCDLLASTETEQAPTALLYNATGVGALFARSDWTTSASWMSTVAGPFDQSHAHRDQGSFSFYKGAWLAVTANIWTDSGINQGADVHNVIRFMSGGTAVVQNHSVSTKTVSDVGGVLTVTENLTPAYSSHASVVSSWQRLLAYTRASHRLRVHDTCTVAVGVTPIWQVIVPSAPSVVGNVITAGNLQITTSAPVAHTITTRAMSSLGAEYNQGYRVELSIAPGAGCEFDVELQAL